MKETIAFIAHQEISKEQRERFLRALREAGLAPKPLVADPLTRCNVLLEFLSRTEKSGSGVYICLDTHELILTRVVAGHVRASVAAILADTDDYGAVRGLRTRSELPFVIVFPPSPEGLLCWLKRTFPEIAEVAGKQETLWPGEAKVSGARISARAKFSSEDIEWLERVEKEFRPRLRATPRAVEGTPKSKSLDFSLELRKIISQARELAEHHCHSLITPLHYLAAIAAYPECAGYELLSAMGIAPRALFERALATVSVVGAKGTSQEISGAFVPSDDATELVMRSKLIARERNRRALTTIDFLEGMIRLSDSDAATILAEFGVTSTRITQLLDEMSLREEITPEEQVQRPSSAPPPAVEIAPEQIDKLKEKLGGSRRHGYAGESFAGRSQQPSAAAEESEPRHTSSSNKGGLEEKWSLMPMPADKKDKAPIVLTCDPQNPALEVVELAADSLLEGKLVAFPTETVYGLGVDATNLTALERLYEVKGRDRSRAIAVLIHSTAQLRHMVREIPDGVAEIMEAFWPGPLTLVFRRHPKVFSSLAPDDSIGVRMPDHYLALSILSMVGRPLATTSANLSGQPPAREASEIIAQLGEKVDLIIDGGPAGSQPPSTVLSVVDKPYRILRVGPVSKDQLEEVGKVPITE